MSNTTKENSQKPPVTPPDFYSFERKHAVKYGLNEAIFIFRLKYLLQLNMGKGYNFIDGRYWTYDSVDVLCQIFPWWCEKTIRRIVISLKNKGAIIVEKHGGIHPVSKNHDRRNWYALSDDVTDNVTKSNSVKKTKSRLGQKDQIIPYNKDNNKEHTPVNGETMTEEIFIDYWNQVAKQANITPIRVMNKERKRKFAKALKEIPLKKDWKALIEQITCNEFNLGKNDRGWRADVEWLFSKNNYLRQLEQSYEQDKS